MREYPKIHALGVRENAGIFDSGVVYAEEKVDGSQFSFGLDYSGELTCRSHHHDLDVHQPPKMFGLAVATAKSLSSGMVRGWTYYGEYLSRPKHNVLAYGRVPNMNIILFDVVDDAEYRLPPLQRAVAAGFLGLEAVPYVIATDFTPSGVEALLDRESVLGGTKVEGVVFKNFERNLSAKYVSAAFKEIMGVKSRVPRIRDSVVEEVGAALATDPRWRKSWQALSEAGALNDSPTDIGPILRAINNDLDAEAVEYIKDALFLHFRKDIYKRATEGFPEWYKRELRTTVLEAV